MPLIHVVIFINITMLRSSILFGRHHVSQVLTIGRPKVNPNVPVKQSFGSLENNQGNQEKK